MPLKHLPLGWCGRNMKAISYILQQPCTGVRLQGDWGKIVTPEGSKSPWEALRATKTSPSIFATFEKASTCAKQTFC